MMRMHTSGMQVYVAFMLAQYSIPITKKELTTGLVSCIFAGNITVGEQRCWCFKVTVQLFSLHRLVQKACISLSFLWQQNLRQDLGYRGFSGEVTPASRDEEE